MTQEELERLLAEIAPGNNPGRLTHTEERDTIEVPDPDSPTPGATKKQPVTVHTWVDKGTGMTLKVQANPGGTYTQLAKGPVSANQGAAATTPAQQTAAAGATKKAPVEGRPGIYTVTTSKPQPDGSMAEETHYENEAGQTVPQPTAKPTVIPATINTTSPRMGILVTAPDGTQTVQWVPNENYQNPEPKPISIPGNPRTIYWDDGPGKPIRAEKNATYEKPSKVQYDEKTGRYIEITVDDNGEPIVRDVNRQTTIKPADLPVLQSKYGEIAQGLGRLAQELNQRVARQEMTPQERTEAFTAAYKQAETQVSEINSILENSKAIWSGQVQQRGQSLSETQSRRSFASDAAARAIAAGNQVAQGALPGHGKEIVAGVEALMNMQQRYAQGMGGFRESPEIGLPPALEQARGIGIPGYAMPSGGPPGGAGGAPGPAAAPPSPPNAIGAGSVPSSITPGPPSGADVAAANAATQAQSSAAFGRLGIPPPGNGISNTTDAGGVPREYTPASVTGGGSGQPPVAAMGAALGAGQGYAGGPVAGGAAGMWDPSMAIQGMLGQGGDAAWEEAVRQAAGSFGRFGG